MGGGGQHTFLSSSAPANNIFTAKREPLCIDIEGWGPISAIRYDFTPCFLDVYVLVVAAWGIVGGGLALWFLFSRRTAQAVKKDWHFYLKLLLIGALVLTTALQASLQIEQLSKYWYQDFRFWTTVLTVISLLQIGTVQYHEHFRSRQPNGVVLFYWLFFIIAYGIKLRSLVSREFYKDYLPFFVTFTVSTGLAILEFGFEYLIPKQQSAYDELGKEDECPMEYADVFQILTFSWMTPMMKYGYNNFLTQDDLWNLRERDTTRTTSNALEEAWEVELQKKKPSLWIALIKAFGGPYFRGAIIKTFSDCFSFIQPQLLRLLIAFAESYRAGNEPQPAIRGVAIALAMFAVSVMQTSFLHQYFQRTFESGMRVKSSLTAMIYAKSLRLSNEGRATKTTGDIVNHMAVDQQRLADLTQFGQQLWSAPFQIVLCMISLHQLVGLSMLAGIAVMILMVPVNGVIARLMKKLQITQMKNKDARTRLMTEILNNMKSIKLYAWTTAFMNNLSHIRNDLELNTLRKIGAAQAFANFTWSTTPFLVSCSTFTVFVLTNDRPLTTEIVFPALTLFNLLTFPLAILPMVITSIIEASVAVKRLTEYFQAAELQDDAVSFEEPPEHIGDETVHVSDATFTWDKNSGDVTLENINFSARKGELSCVVGRVGAGKSSFLQSILGDLWKINGEVVVRGKIAYVAQSPWVMNASVKENIVFGHRWDPHFYNLTVEACALTDDLATLPDGDATQVGERGISLSGGQKARLTLARAVYARADIYLLDDVLSAVDQHVGRHIINRVLGAGGLLNSKTRILATNAITVLKEADFIGLIKDKTVIEKGTYEQLMAMKGEVAELIRSATNNEEEEDDSPSEMSDEEESDESATAVDIAQASDIEEAEEAREAVGQLAPIRPAPTNTRKTSMATLRRASTASFKGPRGKLSDEEDGNLKSKQTKETSEQGKVKWSVYREYAKTSNLYAVGIYIVALLCAQTASVGGNVWLKNWSETNERSYRNPKVGKYIGIYFAFGIGSAGLVVVQTLILWIFCSIEASRKLHERMAFAIFRSPMSFFDTTPAGRILNRFSSDIYKVDEVLARTFNMLFVNGARAIFTLGIVTAATPAFLILIIPLAFIYLAYQKYYLRTSRELKRLDSVSRSPVYAHFQESLGGLSTIRAYRQQHRFVLENEWRMDANLRAYFPSINANRWLAVRLEFLGSVIIFASATFAIISVTSRNGLSAGFIGLAMSYCLQITQSLNWIVRQTVEVETNIVSVERVLEYANLPSEAPEVIFKNRPNLGWPANGAVHFEKYSTRYREGLDLVLKDITLDIKAHEKIGVNHRAHKWVNLDAALFEGTIRDNLDPRHVHDDSELWSVLGHARLKDHVAQLDGQLSATVNEGGSNLSQGQRQLISLARALLTPSSILVLDEATAAVDVQTDALLQATLRTPAFQNRTIITIAHRINTILDSDRIVVLQQGQVAEFDTPRNLVDKKGLFYELVKEAGLLDAEGGIEGSLRRMKEEAQLVIARGVEARGVDERSVVDIPPSNGNRLG
ncbi:putative abc metal ion transporter [Phaeomoniella chlamydospora]|uniref:Putative abc metal ion transporter n=1 Tax=Phaeomoniella chlamydospora TaxID=158046 RepID=A0A0G2GGA7_PHACM|nr:putative abc metal ion transporter [Phaeomoniella chlamydospora]